MTNLLRLQRKTPVNCCWVDSHPSVGIHAADPERLLFIPLYLLSFAEKRRRRGREREGRGREREKTEWQRQGDRDRSIDRSIDQSIDRSIERERERERESNRGGGGRERERWGGRDWLE